MFRPYPTCSTPSREEPLDPRSPTALEHPSSTPWIHEAPMPTMRHLLDTSRERPRHRRPPPDRPPHGVLAPTHRANPTSDLRATPPRRHHPHSTPPRTGHHRRQPTSTRSRSPPTTKPSTRRTHAASSTPQITPNSQPAGSAPNLPSTQTTSQHPSSPLITTHLPTNPPETTTSPRYSQPNPLRAHIGHVSPSIIDVGRHRPPPPETTALLAPHHRSTKGTPQGSNRTRLAGITALHPTTPPTLTDYPAIAGIPHHHRPNPSRNTNPTSTQAPPTIDVSGHRLPQHHNNHHRPHQNRPHCLQRPCASPTSTRECPQDLRATTSRTGACMIDTDQFFERLWPLPTRGTTSSPTSQTTTEAGPSFCPR